MTEDGRQIADNTEDRCLLIMGLAFEVGIDINSILRSIDDSQGKLIFNNLFFDRSDDDILIFY